MKSRVKTALLTLTVSCLLILSGCSSKAVGPTYIYEKQTIESSLFEVGCVEIGAGDTVRTLAHGFVMNRSCLRAYVELVEGLKRTYTKEETQNDTGKPTIGK